MPFGMVSGVGPGIDVRNRDWGPRGSRERVDFGVVCPIGLMFQRPNFKEKCIRVVREKLRLFPYAQYIVGIYVLFAFRRCTRSMLGFTSNMQKK